MKYYRISIQDQDPKLQLKLPLEILRDVTLRSEENGRDITVEIALRLARSLEQDIKREVEDQHLEASNPIRYSKPNKGAA